MRRTTGLLQWVLLLRLRRSWDRRLATPRCEKTGSSRSWRPTPQDRSDRTHANQDAQAHRVASTPHAGRKHWLGHRPESLFCPSSALDMCEANLLITLARRTHEIVPPHGREKTANHTNRPGRILHMHQRTIIVGRNLDRRVYARRRCSRQSKEAS